MPSPVALERFLLDHRKVRQVEVRPVPKEGRNYVVARLHYLSDRAALKRVLRNQFKNLESVKSHTDGLAIVEKIPKSPF